MKRILSITIMFLVILPAISVFTPQAKAESSSLVGYWKFDDGSGIAATDSSGNGNTGTLMNGPQWVDGISGKALKFDGIDDYLSASDSPSLDVSGNQITVMFWVRAATDIDGSNPYLKLYDKGDAYHSAFLGNGKIRFTIAYVHDLDTVRASWAADTWYHIAHVYDGSTISIYVDGVLDNSEPETGSIHVTSLPFTIAAYTYGGQWFFPGTMDEFRIYNHALTPEEIRNDYESAGTTLRVNAFDESGFPPASDDGFAMFAEVKVKIYDMDDNLIASDKTGDDGSVTFNLNPGTYTIEYGGCLVRSPTSPTTDLKYYHPILPSSTEVTVVSGTNEVDLHVVSLLWHVYKWGSDGGDPFELNYLDLDSDTPEYEDSIWVAPGQTVEAEASFWELETVNVPVWYASVFGEWNPTTSLANLASGCSSSSSHNLYTIPFSFTAPTEPGTYHIRLNGALDYDWPTSYYTGGHPNPNLGRDMCPAIISNINIDTETKDITGTYGVATITVARALAWKDETSFGLENSHLKLEGDYSHFNHGMPWFNYLLFKDTATTWTSPWDDIFMLYLPRLFSADSATVSIEAFNYENKAELTYSCDISNPPPPCPPVHCDLTIGIADGAYFYWTAEVTNIGSTTAQVPISLSLYTFIAGDTSNDYYYVPGHGQGQFIGTQENLYYQPTESWVAVWDEAKSEGCGIINTQGFTDLSIAISDWYALTAVPEMAHLQEANGITLAPGETSSVYDCYYYFYEGTGWQKIKTLYDSITQPEHFDPQVHGFGFENYDYNAATCTMYSLKKIYDEFEGALPHLDTGTRILLSAYAWAFNNVVLHPHKGHCYGMSASALYYFLDDTEIVSAGFQCAYDVEENDLESTASFVKTRIETYQHSLVLDSSMILRNLVYKHVPGALNLEEQRDAIIRRIKENGYALVTLKGRNTATNKYWLHEVLAFKYEEVTTEKHNFYCYDSNKYRAGTINEFKLETGEVSGSVVVLSNNYDADMVLEGFWLDEGTPVVNWDLATSELVMWLFENLNELWDALIEFATEASEPWNEFVDWISECVKDIWMRIVEIELSCPAELHIYDATGNHVGLTDDGDLEIGFPAMFFVVGDTQKAVFVNPDKDDYRIEVVGTGNGSFSLDISSFVDGVVISEQLISGETKEGETKTIQILYEASGELTIKEAFPLWIFGAVFAVVLGIGAALILWRKKIMKTEAQVESSTKSNYSPLQLTHESTSALLMLKTCKQAKLTG